MLTPTETRRLITLLRKATPERSEVAGKYEVIVTPTIFRPEDFTPFKEVCIVKVVVGKKTIIVS